MEQEVAGWFEFEAGLCLLTVWTTITVVGCLGFNDPLRQYFSLYRAVSQREGERGEKG